MEMILTDEMIELFAKDYRAGVLSLRKAMTFQQYVELRMNAIKVRVNNGGFTFNVK